MGRRVSLSLATMDHICCPAFCNIRGALFLSTIFCSTLRANRVRTLRGWAWTQAEGSGHSNAHQDLVMSQPQDTFFHQILLRRCVDGHWHAGDTIVNGAFRPTCAWAPDSSSEFGRFLGHQRIGSMAGSLSSASASPSCCKQDMWPSLCALINAHLAGSNWAPTCLAKDL